MPPDLTIRRATPNDAQALTDYMTRLVAEPHNNIVLDPGQWTLTVAEEREFLAKAAADQDRCFLVGELGGAIVACGNIRRQTRPTMRHGADFGISVDAAHRGKGIGRALVKALLAWAQEHKLRRVELKVFTRNTIAINLYKSLGFVEEGLHRMACLKQGVWVDEYTMALILDS